MTDRLTDAVVDIATQLRRIADAHTTPNGDAPTTTTVDSRGPAEQCHAGLGDNPGRHCIRPARHAEDHTDADGWHWMEDIAVYPDTREQPDAR